MALSKVPGTKIRNGIYHLNLRIPKDARSEFDGAEFVRRSLRTSDARTAEREVTLAKASIYEAQRTARRKADLPKLLETLPLDQRRLYEEAGGLEGLLRAYRSGAIALKLHAAGEPSQDEEDETDDRHPREVIVDLTAHRAGQEEQARFVAAQGKTLRALGQAVDEPGVVFGLRELAREFLDKKAARKQTREVYEYVVRRALFLAAFVTSSRDPRFKAFRQRLQTAGKPFKVAITACAGKLLTMLNAMVRSGENYRKPA